MTSPKKQSLLTLILMESKEDLKAKLRENQLLKIRPNLSMTKKTMRMAMAVEVMEPEEDLALVSSMVKKLNNNQAELNNSNSHHLLNKLVVSVVVMILSLMRNPWTFTIGRNARC